MGDLQKFIRQHFFDNNWAKSIDIESLAEEKLRCIDSSFNQIDVKSKLCLLFAFSSCRTYEESKINKHVESVFLQALDEENNLVKAIATILHSKQSLNYLNFDISPTNEVFENNIEKLLKSADNWNSVETPLLAEYLGHNVLGKVMDSAMNKLSQTDSQHHSSENSIPSCGFRYRCKPDSDYLRASYLEKLKDECHRRRVHVPIPGRSFARHDDCDDNNNDDLTGFMKSPAGPRRESHFSKRKSTFPRVGSRNSEDMMSKQSFTWSRPNARKLDASSNENRPMNLNERIAARTPTSNALRKPSGIKILDFDELPAFGQKAKQLRKEKERELKKQREERAREEKAIRATSRVARQTERHARRTSAISSTTVTESTTVCATNRWLNDSHEMLTDFTEQSQNSEPSVLNRNPSTTVQFYREKIDSTKEFKTNFPNLKAGDGKFYNESMNSINNSSFNLQYRPVNPNTCVETRPVIHHPLLSASVSLSASSNLPYVEDEDDDDDDDDDDEDAGTLQSNEAGFYRLGIPKKFVGFNATTRPSLVTEPSNLHPVKMPRLVVPASPSLSSSSSSSVTTTTSTAVAAAAATTFTNVLLPDTCRSVQPFHSKGLSSESIHTPSPSLTPSSPSNSTISIVIPNVQFLNSNLQNPFPQQQSNLQNAKVLNVSKPDSPLRIIRLSEPNSGVSQSNLLIPQPIKPVNNSAQTISMVRIADSPMLVNTHPRIPNQQPTAVKLLNTSQQLPLIAPRPRTSTSDSLVRIAPRPPRIIRTAVPCSSGEINTATRLTSTLSSSSLNFTNHPVRVPANQLGVQVPFNIVGTQNQTYMLDGRSVILAPNFNNTTTQQSQQIPLLPTQSHPQRLQLQQQNQQQSVQRYSIITSRPSTQSPVSQTYVQILPRSTLVNVRARNPAPVTVWAHTDPNEFSQLNTTDSMKSVHFQPQLTDNTISSANMVIHRTLTPGTILSSVGKPLTGLAMNQFAPRLLIPTEVGSMHATENHNNTNSIPTSVVASSSVRIQDDLSLTENQLNVVQNLFQGANRVTRPEKAMILSFIAGSRDNPRPEAGNMARIRLSEYRERVLNQATGQLMDLAVDTYINMDYSTGKYEKIKCYRTETPENLIKLPVIQAGI